MRFAFPHSAGGHPGRILPASILLLSRQVRARVEWYRRNVMGIHWLDRLTRSSV